VLRYWCLNNRRHRLRSRRAGSRHAGHAGCEIASSGLLRCCASTGSGDRCSGGSCRCCGRDDVPSPIIRMRLPRDIFRASNICLRLLRRCETTLLSAVHRCPQRRSRGRRVVLVCRFRKRCSTWIGWWCGWGHLGQRAFIITMALLLLVAVRYLRLLIPLRRHWRRCVLFARHRSACEAGVCAAARFAAGIRRVKRVGGRLFANLILLPRLFPVLLVPEA
jgi:hypothetical protein